MPGSFQGPNRTVTNTIGPEVAAFNHDVSSPRVDALIADLCFLELGSDWPDLKALKASALY